MVSTKLKSTEKLDILPSASSKHLHTRIIQTTYYQMGVCGLLFSKNFLSFE